VCPGCSILPVKIFSNDSLIDIASIAEALRYAASFSSVVNNSWELAGQSSAIQSAITEITSTGRSGLGSAVIFSAGNVNASFLTPNYTIENLNFIPDGTHRFILEYVKNESDSVGEDTVWLGGVILPDNTFVDFEEGFPVGWATGGDSPWVIMNDPIHALEERCLTHVAKAGSITHNQSTTIEFIITVSDSNGFGDIYVYVWTSSEKDEDEFTIRADYNNDGSIDASSRGASGANESLFNVSYPAAYPETIAVGASSNFDCRSRYSRFGPELDFLAPSSGNLRLTPAAPNILSIQTTDRTGDVGATSDNYYSYFGGTSAAAPQASGIAGLMISRSPELNSTQIREAMRNTADKVGPEAYVAGRNDRYGFGRLNTTAVLSSIAKTRTDFNLTVHKTDAASGTVESDVPGINCGTDCSATFDNGTIVRLSVTTHGDAIFQGYSGGDDCGDGQITMSDNIICTANFTTVSGNESNPGGGAGAVSIFFLGLFLVLFIHRQAVIRPEEC
jgi:subtilisin family serine protease